MITNTKDYLGIDISKKHFDAALLSSAGRYKHKKFLNDASGFAALDVWLAKWSDGHLHACMEATNIYGHALAEHIYDHDFNVSMVNPARVKGFAQSELLRTKTDKQDASLIARFCQAMAPPLWVPEPINVRNLKALVRRLDALIEMQQQEVNRLDVAEAVVKADIEGHIESLDSRIVQLREEIRNHIDDDPDLKEKKSLLLTIPGIGEKTVATILAYFGAIERFSSAKQLASFCGVAPREFSSGTSINKRAGMSKIGPSQLRKALFFPAMVGLRYNPIMVSLNQRLTLAGKPKMLIIGAAMRKLTHIIYGVLTNKVPFDANIEQNIVAT